MQRRSFVSFVLAAALLAAPVLASAHDADHGLQEAAHACVVCVYAHGGGHGALPAALALTLVAPVEAPAAAPAAAQTVLAARLHPIRGPPTLLP